MDRELPAYTGFGTREAWACGSVVAGLGGKRGDHGSPRMTLYGLQQGISTLFLSLGQGDFRSRSDTLLLSIGIRQRQKREESE